MFCFPLQFTQTKKSMYALYCSNYDNAEAQVLRLRKKRDVDMQIQVKADFQTDNYFSFFSSYFSIAWRTHLSV